MKITMTTIPILTPLNSLKNTVSKRDVVNFKKKWCNENEIISKIITDKLRKYFISPVLDVGAGIGDIAYNALYDMKVICIDINKVSLSDHALSPKHKRLQKNFFDYAPAKKINTLFISHSLQFIDDDIVKLNLQINKLNPQNIVLVLNKNDDFMGELVNLFLQNHNDANPEIKLANFPNNYKLIDSVSFKATLSCSSFESLAKQISYLMLTDLSENTEKNLIRFLKKHLIKPEFIFNQVIEIHTQNEK